MKIQKKNLGGGEGVVGGCRVMGGWGRLGEEGVRVDVNEELKFLGKFKKKNFGGGGSGGLGRGGAGCRVGGREGSVA